MALNSEIETFAADWVARNLPRPRGLSPIPGEIDRLAAGLTGDARMRGISGGDLHRTLGDIDDYLTEEYRKAGAPAA